MQIGISRVGLDHILEATGDQTEVGAGRELAKLRTTSQLRAKSAGSGRAWRAGPLTAPPGVYMIEFLLLSH